MKMIQIEAFGMNTSKKYQMGSSTCSGKNSCFLLILLSFDSAMASVLIT